MKVKRIATYLTAAVLSTVAVGAAHAGSIYLTGHDVDFHGNQNGYDIVILNWLRGAGTGSEIAAASYDIGVLRTTGVGGFTSPAGFGSLEIRDPSSFANAAAFASWLATKDVIEIASHTSCGGCALTTASSNLINGFAPQITDFFNAGGDIWANTGGTLATYYNFLPPGAVATGTSISGSSGFECTAAGVAIGIDCDAAGVSNINGFPTHNRFSSFDSDFTVFEIRRVTGGVNEAISIGLREGRITDGGITDGGGDGGTVPEPGTLALMALAALGFSLRRRRR